MFNTNKVIGNIIGRDKYSKNTEYEDRCPFCGSFVKDYYHPPTGGYFRCFNKKCKNYNKQVFYNNQAKIIKVV